ncbi:MAG: hypothetical protein ACK4N5_20240, partial [Myxococcales bacterium]
AERGAAALPADAPLGDRAAAAKVVSAATVGAISDLIDELEVRVRREIPQARHIDLEVDHTEERAQKRAAHAQAHPLPQVIA